MSSSSCVSHNTTQGYATRERLALSYNRRAAVFSHWHFEAHSDMVGCEGLCGNFYSTPGDET